MEHEIPFKNYFLSPLSGIWKVYPNKVSLIQNLSAPKSDSINSSIPKHVRKTEYVPFHTLIELANSVGIGGWLWIIDLKDSYFSLPILQQVIHLFGAKWYDKFIFYACLPFGLATAPKQFQKFADSIKFILETTYKDAYYLNKVFELLYHYLDDFFGGHPNIKIAKKQFKYLFELLKLLGIPTSDEKCTKPSQIIVILGFLLDTLTQTVSIPPEKIKKYISDIKWLKKHETKCTLKKLYSIDGKVRHCSTAMYGGAAYCRGIEALIWKMKYIIGKSDHQPFTLSPRAKYDLDFWLEVLPLMTNKTPFKYILKDKYQPDIVIYADASENDTRKAFGGIDTLGHFYCQSFFDTNMIHIINTGFKLINVFELIAVVVGIEIHKEYYKNKCILIRCDNESACGWLTSQSAKYTATTEYLVQSILKYLFRLLIKYKIYISVKRISSTDNVYADKLSRLHPFWFNYIQHDLIGWQHKPQPTCTDYIVNKILNQFELDYDFKLDSNFKFKTVNNNKN